ncbi:MAG: hypothetical protein IJQ81_00415 [Oscillibacter sp.]|nr:hypothetical protein [Oscillibacter sp.]
MEYTIREMIARKGRALEETDYVRSNKDMLDFRLISGDFYEWEGGKLRFKDSGVIMDFAQVTEAFPPFGHIQYKSREKFPYLTDNLDSLLTEWKRGKTVAVEGGPCLFGEHEVLVSVQLKNGRARLFDYANGKAYPPGTENLSAELFATDTRKDSCDASETLAEYLRLHGQQTERISFRQEKQALTPQEYLNLRYPFEMAAALGGPLVIPIPDMSYCKYLLSVLEFVPEELRAQTLAEFDAVSDCITNFFLKAIDALQSHWRIEHFLCVHKRNAAAVETWYRDRAPYIERHKLLRHLTRFPEKMESVKDYVSMPALPFYLFGAENILEVNNMTEMDSYRKCKAAHRNALRMGCILFPELFSGDGIHLFYFAPPQWKAYDHYDNGLSEGEP